MGIRVWSTEGVSRADRFDYWREAVCQTVLNVSTEHRPDDFTARICGQSFGALRFASFRASCHEIVRRKSDIARAADDHYLISLQREGQSQIAQEACSFALTPGEIAILDGNRPFRVSFPGSVARILALIPRRELDARAPWLRRNPAHKIDTASPYLDLARLHLVRLAESGSLSDAEAALLTDNLCNLLALSTTADQERQRCGVTLDMLLADCRRNLCDPALSPAAVAARLGISVRTLHSRFAATGQSFGEWVLANRLDLARKVLMASQSGHGTIAGVAYGCGFRDLSYFNRSFRARFAMTPGDCRPADRGPRRI